MPKEERLYMYPKSSCNCYGCSRYVQDINESGIPTNLAVRNCCTSGYDCNNRKFLSMCKGNRTDCDNGSGCVKGRKNYSSINPQVYSDKYSTYFEKTRCPGQGTCCKEQFVTRDPRTWSATHAQRLTFDNAPIESTIKLKNIYNENLRGYGKDYKTYSDIDGGQILYYTDKQRENAYYYPLFDSNTVFGKVLYKDPMGAMKPEYPRVVKYKNPILERTCKNEDGCLSFIRDTQQHRQDILTSNMVKINQQRWEPRWSKCNG